MSTIITTQELDTYTGQTLSPTKAALMVNAVNSYIENATGRSWGAVATVTDELHDYAPVIFLRHQDVTGVTAVKQGQSSPVTLQPSEYFVNGLGRLVLSESRTGFKSIRDYLRVTYTHGIATVPADLKLAALSLASEYYNYADGGNQELTSEGIGSYRMTYATGKDSSAGGSHFDTINRYRTVRA